MSGWDGCEWNPSMQTLAYDSDDHYRTQPATVRVGAHGQFRLCASCAALPRFRRYTHTPLTQPDPPVTDGQP